MTSILEDCNDCGVTTWPDYAIGNDLWSEIGVNGLLCFNCLAYRFQKKYGVDGNFNPLSPLVIYVAGVGYK